MSGRIFLFKKDARTLIVSMISSDSFDLLSSCFTICALIPKRAVRESSIEPLWWVVYDSDNAMYYICTVRGAFSGGTVGDLTRFSTSIGLIVYPGIGGKSAYLQR